MRSNHRAANVRCDEDAARRNWQQNRSRVDLRLGQGYERYSSGKIMSSVFKAENKGRCMSDSDTSIHLKPLWLAKRANALPRRLLRALRRELSPPLYGLQWGDPEVVEPLQFIKNRYVLPYVDPQHNAVEIGPGGGRWTRYLTGFRKLYAVDYYEELLDELRKNFGRYRNISFIKNNGTDFTGIPPNSIDYLFSFGTFVHLDFNVIKAYLLNIKSIMKPGANIVIQYSDKTKIMAQLSPSFSENTPAQMRVAVRAAGYRILEEDTTSLWHSCVIRIAI
jgi:hypothetical protein